MQKKFIRLYENFFYYQKSLLNVIFQLNLFHTSFSKTISQKKMITDMSIMVKSKAYFQKINTFAKIQKQVKKPDEIDKKLKDILHSDITKIESQQSSQILSVQVSQQQNLGFFTQKFFQGKLYIAWLFILKKIPIKTLTKIKKMQQELQQNGGGIESIIPFETTFEKALKYFEAPQTYFKLLIDLENAEQLVKHLQENSDFLDKIAEIHIYSSKSDGKSAYDKIRSKIKNPKKVSQLLYEIDYQLDDIHTYLFNCRRFLFQDGKVIPKVKGLQYSNMLPGYIKLSGQDKTEVTKYRMNLYRWINVKSQSQQKKMMKIFEQFVRGVYPKNDSELENLNKYIEMKNQNRFGNKQVLEFYSDQTFYYKVINAMLKVTRQIEDFKRISTPFTQLYRSIKYFYQIDKQKLYRNQTQRFSLYRGTTFNIKKVKVGQYIELLGFTSTSKDKEIAKKFLKINGCLMEIIVPPHIFKLKRSQDHGFVDFNQNIQAKNKSEKQVLINALNILKVVEIIPKAHSDEEFDQIVLQYGAIFQLQHRKNVKPQSLSLADEQVMTNFQYCLQQMTEIKDEIDLLIQNEEYNQASAILKKKITQEKENIEEMKIKYAQVLYEAGEKTASSIIVRQVLNKFLQTDENPQKQEEKLKKHAQKVTEIFKADDDIVSAKKVILKQIQHLDKGPNPSIYQKARKLFELGKLSFEQGNIQESEQRLRNSCDMITSTLLGRNSKQLDSSVMKSYELKLNILILMMEISNHIGNSFQTKELYLQADKSYSQYYNLVINNSSKRNSLNQIKARLNKYSSQKSNVNQTEVMLEQVLRRQEKINPNNDKVAQLSAQLAVIKAQELIKNINQPSGNYVKEENNIEGQKQMKFVETQMQQKASEVEKYFEKSIEINSYRKGKDHPTVLNLRNKQGEFECERGNFIKSINQSNIVIQAQKLRTSKTKARAVLILSKDYFYTGQLLKSFQTVELVKKILEWAIIKSQKDIQYEKELEFNEIYIHSQLLKIKLYNKQLQHDLALQNVFIIQQITHQKLFTHSKQVGYWVNILQEKGSTLAFLNQLPQAFQCFNLAISLRKTQYGNDRIANAISYCTLAKFQIFYKNFQEAKNSINQADLIFSKFPSNTPNNWILSFVKAYFYKKINYISKEKQAISEASRLVEKRYNPDYINYLMVKLHEAKTLQKQASKQKDYIKVKQKLNYLYNLLINDPNIEQFIDNKDQTIYNQKVLLKQEVQLHLKHVLSNLNKSDNLSTGNPINEINLKIQNRTITQIQSQNYLYQLNPEKKPSQQTKIQSTQQIQYDILRKNHPK